MTKADRLGNPAPRTLAEALDVAAAGHAGINFFSARGELESSLSYAALRSRALGYAAGCELLGLERGSRVAIIAETSPDFLALFYGLQYAGLVPCPLPFITYLGGKDAYIARIAQLSKAARAGLICAPDILANIATAAAERAGTRSSCFGEMPIGGQTVEPVMGATDELAYIQFSSGSTALPKGVPVTQSAAVHHARIVLEHGMRLNHSDRAFSWLPFYHDMGLFGFSIAPLFGCCSVDYIAPSTFARRPNLWTELMSRQGSTITYAPSFGYRLAAQRYAVGPLDLSQLRVAGIGGDMIRADVLGMFAERFAPSGFHPSAFMPSYGMAEATLAVSFGRGVNILCLESETLAIGKAVTPAAGNSNLGARNFVSCGAPVPELDVVITDEDGCPLPNLHVGKILIRGPAVMGAYDGNSDATAAILNDDGFMDTGDIGFFAGDQLVLTGRLKDVMHHRGRNIWPEDVEWIVERLEPLRQGDVAAIAIPDAVDGERLICLVQAHLPRRDDRDDVRARIAAAISEGVGIVCEIVFVPPKTLPMTTSGKLARQVLRAAYLAGSIKPLDNET